MTITILTPSRHEIGKIEDVLYIEDVKGEVGVAKAFTKKKEEVELDYYTYIYEIS